MADRAPRDVCVLVRKTSDRKLKVTPSAHENLSYGIPEGIVHVPE